MQLGASAVLDTAGNAIEAQVARTAVGTWNKDTVKPSITAFSITQGGSEVTSAKAGTITVSFTLSEVASTTPVISIDQPGETDISNTAPTGAGGNVYTYVYTVNASSTPQYLDGTATVIISGAQDYAGNTMDADSSHTFTIDTQVPDTAVSEPAIGDKSTSSVTLTWTPTYTAADFSTYKVYYGTSAGVTSSTGTEINKNTDGYSTLGASSTTGITVSGLSSSTSYYFVVYTCDTAGNCSPASAEITADTNSAGGGIVPSTSSGGGGGNSSSSAGSSFSVSKSITTAGGSVTMALDSESGITVTLAPNLLNTATTITISDATSAQKGSAPVSSSEGTLVGNTAYTISAISTGTSLTTLLAPAAVTMQYTNTQYGSDGEALRVAYFSISENKWIPLATTVNLAARTASVLTDRVGLFALINYVAAPVSEPESVPVDGSAPVDTGTVLGSSTGAYPNGSLLKAPGSSAVWYISNGEKHLITSAAVFQTRFNWNDIITLPSSLQLGLYQQGVDVQFGSGTLVKEAGNSAVFRIAANGQKQPIISADVFAARGYNFKNVLEVESGALDSYQTGTEIADAAVLDGDLVKRADSVAVYLVEDGMLRLIPHESVFNGYAFSFASVRTVEPAQLNAFERGSDLMYPDGTLVKGNASAVYVIADGKRRPIVSAYDFEALLYDWSKIVYVPEALLAAIDIASAIRLVQLDNTEGTVSAAVAQ